MDNRDKKKQSFKFKNKGKFSNSTKKEGVRKLFIRIDADTSSEFTNIHDWMRDHWRFSIGKYSSECQKIMERGTWDYETLEEKLSKFPIKEPIPTSHNYWITTDDEQDTLDAIDDESKREREEKKLFKKWVDDISKQNEMIKNQNNINENQRKHVMEVWNKMDDLNVKIFTEIYASIEYDGQQMIEAYSCKASEVNLARDVSSIIGEFKYDDDAADKKKAEVEVGNADEASDAGDGDEEKEGVADDESRVPSLIPIEREDQILNMRTAKKDGNWLWLFRAAIDTHSRIVVKEDLFENRQRAKEAEERLRQFKYLGGSFYQFLDTFQDKVKVAKNLGAKLEDIDLILYLMSGLPRDLFTQFISDFKNPRLKSSFPTTFQPMLEEIKQEYRKLSIDKKNLVAEYIKRKGGKDEKSFKTSEKPTSKKDQKLSCVICGKNHETDKCQHRNFKYSQLANKGFYERMVKRETKESVPPSSERGESKPPTAEPSRATKEESYTGDPDDDIAIAKWANKGTVARKKTESSSHLFESRITDLYMEEHVTCDNYISEESFAVKETYLPDEIDFVYDTATVSGTIKPSDSPALSDIRRDPMHVRGVGGAVQLLDKSGQSIFGKIRVLKRENDANLISHHEAEKLWQLNHPEPGVMFLKEWKPKTGKVWRLYKDEIKYGDPFYHLSVTRAELPIFMKSAGATEESYALYNPPPLPSMSDLTRDELVSIDKVDNVHKRLNHATAEGLIRVLDSEVLNDVPIDKRLGIEVSEVKLWKSISGDYCSGCAAGKMKEHDRKSTSNKREFSIGEACVGDLAFIELSNGRKVPAPTYCDCESKFIMGQKADSKSIESMKESVKQVQGNYKQCGHSLKEIIFDRESAMVALEYDIMALGIKMNFKASGQKVGLAEYTIGYLRALCRATKNGVWDRLGYKPPSQWNYFLWKDTINCANRIVRPGFTKSPAELFTGIPLDPLRDLRAEWGEIVIVKKAKRIAADLESSARWGVVIYRAPYGSGAITFYMVDTRSIVVALKFVRAKVPRRVIDALNDISPDEVFRADDDTGDYYTPIYKNSSNICDNNEDISDGEEEADDDLLPSSLLEAYDEQVEAELTAPDDSSSEIITARNKFVEAYKNSNLSEALSTPSVFIAPVEDEPYVPGNQFEGDPFTDPVVDEARPTLRKSVRIQEASQSKTPTSQEYTTRSKRVSKPPDRLTYSAFYTYEDIRVLFEQALKSNKADSAKKALDKELDIIENKSVFHGILESSLDKEQRARIIRSMVNYIEKYLPSGEFDKSKVRLLIRGDQQWDVGQTESPVCRVESIFLIINIAIMEDLEVIKIDFTAAYLNSKMVDDVKHKWVLLPRTVVQKLLERDRAKWEPFLRYDGTILVEMDKVMYGYKEAAIQWFNNHEMMMLEGEYSNFKKDPCFFYKFRETDKGREMMLIGTTVDDNLCANTRGTNLKQELLDLMARFFEKYTVEEGDTINVIGMTFKFDRVNKLATVTQKRFVEKLTEARQIFKAAVTPATEDLFDEDESSPLLKDQLDFMSINGSCNYAGNRCFPEILPAVAYLSGRYRKATEQDLKKVTRVVEFFNLNPNHCLCFKPISYKVVAYADASFGERSSGHSLTGGCIGLEGANGNHSFFMFVASQQPVIAKSSTEAEVIAASTTADNVVWLLETLEILGFKSKEPAVLYQDNKSAILIEEKGRGTFKRFKHVQLRFLWIDDLVKLNQLRIEYVPTAEMIADILTKPLIGTKFRYLQAKLLGWYNLPGEEETVGDKKEV